MNAHSEIEALFVDYDRLTLRQFRDLEAHSAGCPACAARLADYRRMEHDFARLRDPLAGPQLDAAIRQTLARAQQPKRSAMRLRTAPLPRFGVAAALLVVLAAGWLLLRGDVLWARVLPPRMGGAIPTPRSAAVDSFVWQADGAYGYQILRPRGWSPVDASASGGWRAFERPVLAEDGGSLSLMVANLEVGKDLADGYVIGGLLLQLFEKDRTLPAWTAAFEREAGRGGALLEQVRTLPDARIYLWNLDPASGAAQFMLVGLKVDRGRPLAVVVFTGGAYADLERLKQDGFLEDLATMVGSARAIPADAKNVVPSLASAAVKGVPVPRVRGTLTPPAPRSGPVLMMTPTPTPTPDAAPATPDAETRRP